MSRAGPERIAAVRRFNRFYTRHIGVLRKGYLDSPYSLGEMRVLYEIFRGHGPTASDIARALDLDAGYISRVLRSFEKQGLISRETSTRDARQSHLTLTARGKKTFAPLEKKSQDQVANMLGHLDEAQQARLVGAMNEIERLLGDAPATDNQPAYILRPPKPGDFGWVVSRHAELYLKEYGWGDPFEGLCAQIVADFANKNDPARERCWIAERGGEPVGSIFLVKDSETVARIRLLLVDPKGRGLGIGKRLVDECVSFARATGYKQITLWTHSVLAAARHIYEQAGFTLTSSEKRKSWGQDVVAEFWDLTL